MMSVHDVTEQIGSIAERPTQQGFWLPIALTGTLVCLLVAALWRLVGQGVGVWGNNQSIGWAWDIAGFVFWIGIGHAGTLISAILYLFRQRWRTSINRAAEAATIFAVIAAAVYPVFHLGRVWLAYWLIPAPNQMLVWPNFKSPLTWDVFAISTYFIVSLVFWYVGMVPDLATLRDRSKTALRRRILGFLALGWRNSQRHWLAYERAYLTLSGLGTALVISVHTIVSFDFAVAILPGWHNTIFPPYFVAGAVLSGSAVVATILVCMRRAFRLEASITERHLENLNKLILAMSWMVALAYVVEIFLAWYSGEPFEQSALFGRMHGPLSMSYWAMLTLNVALPQLFWLRAVRTSATATLVIGIGVSVGMWLERFVIVVGGLDRGFLPSTWSHFRPTLVDLATLAGTLGLFLTLYLLFLRWVPIINMSEVKAELQDAASGDGTAVLDEELDAVVTPEMGRRAETSPDVPLGPHVGLGEAPVRLLLARCDELDVLRRACRKLNATTNRHVDAHAPFPLTALGDDVPLNTSLIAWCAGFAGVLGGTVATAVQYWTQSIGYPMMLGGKPAWSWQTSVPITFELTILGAALGCFAGFLWVCKLPNLSHPLLTCQRFRQASDDGFYISVEVTPGHVHECIQAMRSAGLHNIVGVND